MRRGAVTLPTRADGSVCLGVVADTHSRPHAAMLGLLRARSPDAILHAGDIGDRGVLEALATVAPVYAVRGNIDARTHDLVCAGRSVLRILLVHVAVRGPRLRADVARVARDADTSLIVCGHSHVPFIGEDRGFTVFNPGSAGPRRFSLPIVFGVLALDERGLRLEHVSCETREAWSPP